MWRSGGKNLKEADQEGKITPFPTKQIYLCRVILKVVPFNGTEDFT